MRLKFAASTAAFSLRETSNFLRDMGFSARARARSRGAHELRINILQKRSGQKYGDVGNEKTCGNFSLLRWGLKAITSPRQDLIHT